MPIIKPPLTQKELRKLDKEEEKLQQKREGFLIKHTEEYYEKKRQKIAENKRIQRLKKKADEIEKRGALFVKHRQNFIRLREIEETYILNNEWHHEYKKLNDEYDSIIRELNEDGIDHWPTYLPQELNLIFELIRQMRLNPEICIELMGFDPINSAEGFRITESIQSKTKTHLRKVEEYRLRRIEA